MYRHSWQLWHFFPSLLLRLRYGFLIDWLTTTNWLCPDISTDNSCVYTYIQYIHTTYKTDYLAHRHGHYSPPPMLPDKRQIASRNHRIVEKQGGVVVECETIDPSSFFWINPNISPSSHLFGAFTTVLQGQGQGQGQDMYVYMYTCIYNVCTGSIIHTYMYLDYEQSCLALG